MTNWTKELKPLELKTWENGSTWQRARIAYRHDQINALTTEELAEIMNTVDEKNFLAEMSDSWQVTCSEKYENSAIAQAAEMELEKRS